MRTRSQGLDQQRGPDCRDTVDLAQVSGVEAVNRADMRKPTDQVQRSEPNSSKARLEEARRAAEEYAEDLREIIRRLRERFLN